MNKKIFFLAILFSGLFLFGGKVLAVTPDSITCPPDSTSAGRVAYIFSVADEGKDPKDGTGFCVYTDKGTSPPPNGGASAAEMMDEHGLPDISTSIDKLKAYDAWQQHDDGGSKWSDSYSGTLGGVSRYFFDKAYRVKFWDKSHGDQNNYIYYIKPATSLTGDKVTWSFNPDLSTGDWPGDSLQIGEKADFNLTYTLVDPAFAPTEVSCPGCGTANVVTLDAPSKKVKLTVDTIAYSQSAGISFPVKMSFPITLKDAGGQESNAFAFSVSIKDLNCKDESSVACHRNSLCTPSGSKDCDTNTTALDAFKAKVTKKPLDTKALLEGQYPVPNDYEGPLPACAFPGTCLDTNRVLELLLNFAQFIFKYLGAATFLMFIYGGFMMIFSFGNAERIQSGQKILVAAVIGIAIALSAYLLINSVLNALGVVGDFRIIQ